MVTGGVTLRGTLDLGLLTCIVVSITTERNHAQKKTGRLRDALLSQQSRNQGSSNYSRITPAAAVEAAAVFVAAAFGAVDLVADSGGSDPPASGWKPES